MATVRQYRGRYVADFRDQHGRRRIEVPEGRFETKAEVKRAAKELLDRWLTRFEVEQFRNTMAKGAPLAVTAARERRVQELRMSDLTAKLRPLKPGPRTTNKCLTLLVGILGYAVEHGFATRNVASDMDKLPAAEGEGRVVEQNVLTPAELRELINSTSDPWGMPIMLAAFTGARQAEVLWPQVGRY